MMNVGGKRNLLYCIFGCGFVLLLSACSQSVDKVSITPRQEARPESYRTSVDIQGTSVVAPSSAGYDMPTHVLGGTVKRTSSTSANYRMVSGVGVQ